MTKTYTRDCRVCGLSFTTYRADQKTCFRKKCQAEWHSIQMQAWRLAHPTYHRDYMRRYRRIGKEVSHVSKGHMAYLLGRYPEALEEFKLAVEEFNKAKKLNKAEREDRDFCVRKIQELEE